MIDGMPRGVQRKSLMAAARVAREFVVSAWPEPRSATRAEWSAGVHDGMQAFALGIIEETELLFRLGLFRAVFLRTSTYLIWRSLHWNKPRGP
jgi:hypothetical protein